MADIGGEGERFRSKGPFDNKWNSARRCSSVKAGQDHF